MNGYFIITRKGGRYLIVLGLETVCFKKVLTLNINLPIGDCLILEKPWKSKYDFGQPDLIRLWSGSASSKSFTADVKGTYFMICYATEGNAASVTTTGTILYDQGSTSDNSLQSSYLKIVAMDIGDTCTYSAGENTYIQINYITEKAKTAEFIKSGSCSSWSPSNESKSSSTMVKISNDKSNCYFFAATSRQRGSSGTSSSLDGYSGSHFNSSQTYNTTANYIVVPEKDYDEAGIKLSSWSTSYGTQGYAYLFRLIK